MKTKTEKIKAQRIINACIKLSNVMKSAENKALQIERASVRINGIDSFRFGRLAEKIDMLNQELANELHILQQI